MHALDRILPIPLLDEIDHVDLAAPAGKVWRAVRHGDLARSAMIRALFRIRTLASGGKEPITLRIDDLRSTPEKPGFTVLTDDAPHELVVGAIGKVWEPDIPFVHVPDGEMFRAFEEEGYVKVAWSVRITPRGETGCRLEIEVRVGATDPASWARFQRYFLLIGPGSRFIRHSLLRSLAREMGRLDAHEDDLRLAGDELLPVAEQVTQAVTIAARPEAIWPWLVQMGCRRGGFYSIDLLDNQGKSSARELHPELMHVSVGEIIPASPKGEDGFEVLRVDPHRALVLGGLHDTRAKKQLPFSAPRPDHYWQVTWAFVLEPLDSNTTKLHVRARAAFSESEGLHASWIRPVHALMEGAQLRHIKARAEGRLHRDSPRDVLSAVGGAAIMGLALITPFLRKQRSWWGVDEATAARAFPGDELVHEPRWSWTHGVTIEASAEEVWPWVAQIGADRGGFYSYQWLENLAGCGVKNAERVHPEWAVREGGVLLLHPKMPPLRVVSVEEGRWFVAQAVADEAAQAAGKPWVAASWLFFLEPLGPGRSRFISRFRCSCSHDLVTELTSGPALVEPVGFAMDRAMLLGVKRRAEEAVRAATHLDRMAAV